MTKNIMYEFLALAVCFFRESAPRHSLNLDLLLIPGYSRSFFLPTEVGGFPAHKACSTPMLERDVSKSIQIVEEFELTETCSLPPKKLSCKF